MGLALLLDVFLPGKLCTGPETKTGHVPEYTDNAVLHCVLFSAAFFLFSSEGAGYASIFMVQPYSLGIMCTNTPPPRRAS
jgi:hypothetical protein